MQTMIPLTRALAKQIKSRRTEMGLTQQQLADRVDINRHQISNIEAMRVQSISTEVFNTLNKFFSKTVRKEIDAPTQPIDPRFARGLMTIGGGGSGGRYTYETVDGLDAPSITTHEQWFKERGLDSFKDMTLEELNEEILMVHGFMTTAQKRRYLKVLYVLMASDVEEEWLK